MACWRRGGAGGRRRGAGKRLPKTVENWWKDAAPAPAKDASPHYGSKLPNAGISNHSLSHEIESKWMSKWTNEHGGERKQCGTSYWVYTAVKQANGKANERTDEQEAQYLRLYFVSSESQCAGGVRHPNSYQQKMAKRKRAEKDEKKKKTEIDGTPNLFAPWAPFTEKSIFSFLWSERWRAE